MQDRILVFIPAYNCGPQIGRVLRQFVGIAEGIFAEILVVDNGSRDDTVAAAQAAAIAITCCPVQIVRNVENYNLGGSHKAAFAHALARGYTHVCVFHGDDQGRIADLFGVLEAGQHRTHAACLGARFAPGAELIGYSRFRIFGNRVFNALFTLVTRRRVFDLGSGLNIFGADAFSAPSVLRYADDLRFNIYLLLDLIDRGADILFFPISWREEDQQSNVRLFSQARRTLAIALQYGLRRQVFRRTDHRDVRRPAYRFTTLFHHSAEPPPRAAQATGARA